MSILIRNTWLLNNGIQNFLKLAQKKLNDKLRETCKIYRDLIDNDLSKSSKHLWSKVRCIITVIINIL